MYIYNFTDENNDKYFETIKDGDEMIYASNISQEDIDDFMHIYACGVHFLSEFVIDFDRHNIKNVSMGYLKNSGAKFCYFEMFEKKAFLISPVFCKELQKIPNDPFYDQIRLPSEKGYISYRKAYQSACIIFS